MGFGMTVFKVELTSCAVCHPVNLRQKPSFRSRCRTACPCPPGPAGAWRWPGSAAAARSRRGAHFHPISWWGVPVEIVKTIFTKETEDIGSKSVQHLLWISYDLRQTVALGTIRKFSNFTATLQIDSWLRLVWIRPHAETRPHAKTERIQTCKRVRGLLSAGSGGKICAEAR